MTGERLSHVSPSRSLGFETRQTGVSSLQALASAALKRQQQPRAPAAATDTAPACLSVSDSILLGRETVRQPRAAAGYPPDFDPEASVKACLAEGEEPEVIADFTELIDIIATEPAPERRQLWRLGDWPAYFGERAAIREHD